ncbi:hypothetical protein CROQUDRAFT_40257 [Cronartium quercuum f. sp. fusiforme G11]|uniref:Uncharacterized protein n=1 Tax=Cronartium quercuum f. sp. fusiforme G11 TaxID=708437 RepID=A0A9P6NT90_9BASI|nr:hypothetical protein CROQUDRAFT_40257 [Cronartium quercuum f. sp. fusiforme G11]
MEPASNQIVKQVKIICRNAISAKTQDNLTPREIINELSKIFSIEIEFFKDKAIKTLIKDTARITIEQDGELEEEPEPKEDIKDSDHQFELEETLTVETNSKSKSKHTKEISSPKKTKANLKDNTESRNEPQVNKTGEGSTTKSNSECETIDRSTKREEKIGKKNTIKSAEFIDSDGEPIPGSPPSIEETVRKVKRKSSTNEHDSAPSSKQAKTKSKTGTSTKSNSTVDKQAEEIKRLKSYVVACGVRKRWAQEFLEHPTPQKQIQHLKSILTGLGMPSRCSMAKAKEIRQNRELKDELSELKGSIDDNEEEEGGGRSSRREKKRGKMVINDDESDSQSNEEGTSEIKVKKNPWAFLGDNLGDDSD